jgi:membrane protein implicated in regulation of membrane protease activity
MPYVMNVFLDNIVWVWLFIFVVALLIELVTSDLVSIWFSLGAIPPFILALINVNWILQVVVFLVATFVLIVFTRPYVYKYFKTNEIKTNVDAMSGLIGIVTLEITPLQYGRVKIKSEDWSATSKQSISVGTKVRVLDVEGNKVIVETVEQN